MKWHAVVGLIAAAGLAAALMVVSLWRPTINAGSNINHGIARVAAPGNYAFAFKVLTCPSLPNPVSTYLMYATLTDGTTSDSIDPPSGTVYLARGSWTVKDFGFVPSASGADWNCTWSLSLTPK